MLLASDLDGGRDVVVPAEGGLLDGVKGEFDGEIGYGLVGCYVISYTDDVVYECVQVILKCAEFPY